MTFQFPRLTQRTSIVGRTGSGKSQFAAWLLSHAAFDVQPFIIIDYKYDDLLNSIHNAREIGLNEVPKHPGIYITHPIPNDDEGIENFLWKIWARENTGVFIDESYMIPKNSGAFSALLTQGRSKRIPMINLTQRPAWINRFVFSEADHFAIFHLNDKRDQKKVEEFTPISMDKRLPDYNSHWYDVSLDTVFHLQPVPERDTILERFYDKLKTKRNFL